jgi:hypothetical protein
MIFVIHAIGVSFWGQSHKYSLMVTSHGPNLCKWFASSIHSPCLTLIAILNPNCYSMDRCHRHHQFDAFD